VTTKSIDDYGKRDIGWGKIPGHAMSFVINLPCCFAT